MGAQLFFDVILQSPTGREIDNLNPSFQYKFLNVSVIVHKAMRCKKKKIKCTVACQVHPSQLKVVQAKQIP